MLHSQHQMCTLSPSRPSTLGACCRKPAGVSRIRRYRRWGLRARRHMTAWMSRLAPPRLCPTALSR